MANLHDKSAGYSKDTEVLTDSGWKMFPKLTTSDRVAIMRDRSTGHLTYEHPTNIQSSTHHDDMIAFKSPHVNLLITPNHRILVETGWSEETMVREMI